MQVRLSEVAVREARPPVTASEQRQDPNEIYFGAGYPDPTTVPVAAINEILTDVLGQDSGRALSYDYGGAVELREAIVSALAANEGVRIGTAQIVLANGSSGVMDLAGRILLDRGDMVIAEEVSYLGTVRAFRLAGARVLPVPLDADGMDCNALESLLRQHRDKVKLIYTIATAQNPTGTTLPLRRRSEIVELARRFNVMLMQDNAYGEINLDSPPPSTFFALAPERTIHVGSFSKTLSTGLRVGWAAMPKAVSDLMDRARVDLGTPPLLQRIVGEFMADGRYREHLAKVTELYRRKRAVLLTALEEHCREYCTWNVPSDGYFVWVTPHNPDVDQLLHFALAEGLRFVPGDHFAVEAGLPSRSLRLSYSYVALDRLAEGARRLGTAMLAQARL